MPHVGSTVLPACQVMPIYGNTHSSSSACGIQSTFFYREARQIIKDSVRATDKDAVIFCGSGSTAAIAKMSAILGLRVNATPDKKESAQSDGLYACAFPGCKRQFTDEGSFKVFGERERVGQKERDMDNKVSIEIKKSEQFILFEGGGGGVE